jgi:hypothetical protein
MSTLPSIYRTKSEALRAVEALRALGVSDRDVRLLIGRTPGDVRHEPVGGFAGAVRPDDPVGTYAGGPIRRRRGAGAFAGDADAQRQGSFADTDRVEIVTFENGAGRTRVTGLRGARRLLARTTLDADAIEQAASELARGRAVVLADSDAEAEPVAARAA